MSLTHTFMGVSDYMGLIWYACNEMKGLKGSSEARSTMNLPHYIGLKSKVHSEVTVGCKHIVKGLE